MLSGANTTRLFFISLALMIISMGMPHNLAAQAGSTYRILIIEDQTMDNAETLKATLQRFGYSPVILEEDGGSYNVLYGSFETEAQATKALERLDAEGVLYERVVQSQSGPTISGIEDEGSYTVFVREFLNRIDANRELKKLEEQGFAGVKIERSGLYFQVVVGNFTLDEATVVLGKLRSGGYANTAEVRKAQPVQISAPPRTSDSAPGVVSGGGVTEMSISSTITQSELWKTLSEDQKRQVIDHVVMQQELRQGNVITQKVIDIDRRLQNLDGRLRGLIDQIDEERRQNEETIGKINDLFNDAQYLTRSQDYEQAILKYKEVIALDEENKFGQKSFAERRISYLESRLDGERYEGESEYNTEQYKILEAQARELESKPNKTEADITLAIKKWDDIANLDPTKYGPTAKSKIGQLNEQLKVIQDRKTADIRESSNSRIQQVIMIGGGAGAVLIVLILLLFMGNRKQRKETMELQRKLSEITSMRPMREITGGGAGSGQQMLETGSSSTHGGSDIFTPQSTSVDPLGGVAEDDEEEDSLFGSSSSTNDDIPATPTSGDDMGLDDLFGSDDDTGSPGATATAGDAPSEGGSGEDDVFAGLFDEPDAGSGEATPTSAPAAKKPEKPAEEKKPESVGPISFDDFGSDDASPEDHSTSVETSGAVDASSTDNDDLLALFDDAIGDENEATMTDEPESSPTSPITQDDPLSFGENPFDDLTASPEPDTATQNAPDTENSPLEDSEIPSLNINMDDVGGSAETALNMGGSGSPESDSTSTQGDIPAFAFDEVTAMVGGGGIDLNYEDAAVGSPPNGWTGDYDYASLLVEGDTPPQNASQYLAFRKQEGAGKALYSYSFPEVSGKVEIEFDLCCNDKNKFLLGFYIEKDGDFQQAIHTKILRSEAQTTPTIHMQGESAPYMLGSWAHIKYIVDLNEGTLDGFIDNTQIARSLPLQPNPGSLNTLSIRDNINTTGVLMLNNIKVKSAD